MSNFRVSSSIADDVWHPNDNPIGYEWWYFDALSDDGRDAVVIIFLDNFIFSPRYNALSAKRSPAKNDDNQRHPALAFFYYRDGKPLYRAINEFPAEEFRARESTPNCRIGQNLFRLKKKEYGNYYELRLFAQLRGNRNLWAQFEWLPIESDFLQSEKSNSGHNWNLVTPRADVSGTITIATKDKQLLDEIKFNGTGYHDHNFDSRWLPATVAEWQWGRAHFADTTAVFYRYRETGAHDSTTKLFLVRDNQFTQHNADYSPSNVRRDRFGLPYAKNLKFTVENGVSLDVRQTRRIDTSFFYLRFLSEAVLNLGDGQTRRAAAITEHLAPRALSWRWLDWLVNMRIGRNGRGAFLP